MLLQMTFRKKASFRLIFGPRHDGIRQAPSPVAERDPPLPGEAGPFIVAPSPGRASTRKSGRLWIIPGVVAVVALIAGGTYWYRQRMPPSPAAAVVPPPVAPAAPPQLVSGLTTAPAAPPPPAASEPPQLVSGLRSVADEPPAAHPPRR